MKTNMLNAWKMRQMMKGLLTQVPHLNRIRQRRAATSGSDSPRYCYSVWLRHLKILGAHGFHINAARVGELGPGDSIGIGLAALLSGAREYVGLDIFPFTENSDVRKIFEELVQLYSQCEPIPDSREFPLVRPELDDYAFPNELIDSLGFFARSKKIRNDLQQGIGDRGLVRYQAPWDSSGVISPGSLDLIVSQAVLEHVDDLQNTWSAMSQWLKPGGFASHVIDFGAHYVSPFWNGHWAYNDWQWRVVRGGRTFLLNREPLSTHVELAKKFSLAPVLVKRYYGEEGISTNLLAPRFQAMEPEDRRTRGCMLILRKLG